MIKNSHKIFNNLTKVMGYNMENKTNINWYPGHMAKTKRLIKDHLKLIDIVYELIDARIPFSSKIQDIDHYLKNKPRLLIITKTDLADPIQLNEFKTYYESLGYQAINVDLLNNKNINLILTTTQKMMEASMTNRLKKGLKKRALRALVVGIPNVGKSTLINSLVLKKATKTGNKPGITKTLNWIRINNDLELLDTPGILWPKINSEKQALNLAAFIAIKEELLPLKDVSDYILRMMITYYPVHLKERYQLANLNLNDLDALYKEIGHKRGCLIKGGEIDDRKVSLLIIKDLNDGKLGRVVFDDINN